MGTLSQHYCEWVVIIHSYHNFSSGFGKLHTNSDEQQQVQLYGSFPGSNVHGANMGPIWGRQDPGGPHVGPMNFAIWVSINYI